MKRRVLHLIPSFNQGGSERQALQLVGLLLGEGSYEVRLACLDKTGILFDEAAALGFQDPPEFPLTSFYDANMLVQLRRFVRYLRENRINIVQTQDFYSNIFGMFGAAIAGVPYRIAAKRETGMRSTVQLFAERRAFDWANIVVANSQKVKNYLVASGVRESKVRVIYNGIDHLLYNCDNVDRKAVLRDLGLPEGYRFVTIVANLRSPVKNHAMFLRAAATVAAKFPDAAFVLAGEGELLNEYKAIAAMSDLDGRVHFLGRCSRIPELLAISDVCSLTSRSEGFSNSIIEYMAAGKPVVATNVGGAAEAIIDGKTGYLIESEDVDALAEHIGILLSDQELASRMGVAGRRRVSERFSTETQLKSTLELYAQCRNEN